MAVSCLASVLAAAQSPPPVFDAATNVVLVDVVVTDKQHRPVLDLTKADFAVFEDGRPQQVTSFAAFGTAAAKCDNRDILLGVSRESPTGSRETRLRAKSRESSDPGRGQNRKWMPIRDSSFKICGFGGRRASGLTPGAKEASARCASMRKKAPGAFTPSCLRSCDPARAR